MRKHRTTLLSLIVVLLSAVILSGCNTGKPLLSFYGNVIKAWEKDYKKNSPDELTVYVEYDGIAGSPQVITDAETINEVFDALSSMRVTGEYISHGSDVNVPRKTVTYQFRAGAGTVEFIFRDGHAAIGDKLYICSNAERLFEIERIKLPALDTEKSSTTGNTPAKSTVSCQPKADYDDGGGQYADGGRGEPNDQRKPQEQNHPGTDIKLARYDGGYFSLMLPEGWQIRTMGQYTSFGFYAWNPQNPDCEIFYYGDLGPLNKSFEAKNFWAGYIGNFGLPYAKQNCDAPVLATDSGSSVFYVFEELQALSDKYGLGFSLPALDGLMPQWTIPIETGFAGAVTGGSMMFANVVGSNGGACSAMLMASLWNTIPAYVDGVDTTPAHATHVVGVVAPEEDFQNVETMLTQAVFSLQFTEEYIQDGIAYSRAVGGAAMAGNAELQAVFDRAKEAWSTYFRGIPAAGG